MLVPLINETIQTTASGGGSSFALSQLHTVSARFNLLHGTRSQQGFRMTWVLSQLDLRRCHLPWSSRGPSSPGLACHARLTCKSSILLPLRGGLISTEERARTTAGLSRGWGTPGKADCIPHRDPKSRSICPAPAPQALIATSSAQQSSSAGFWQ